MCNKRHIYPTSCVSPTATHWGTATTASSVATTMVSFTIPVITIMYFIEAINTTWWHYVCNTVAVNTTHLQCRLLQPVHNISGFNIRTGMASLCPFDILFNTFSIRNTWKYMKYIWICVQFANVTEQTVYFCFSCTWPIVYSSKAEHMAYAQMLDCKTNSKMIAVYILVFNIDLACYFDIAKNTDKILSINILVQPWNNKDPT